MSELKETLSDVWLYILKTVIYVKPIWVLFASAFSYVLFPQDSYVPATIAVIIALCLDVITKYYAVSMKNGGLKEAIKSKKLLSETLWRGTKKKLISVSMVLILCGLSYRITPVSSIAVLLSTVSFAFLYLREAQSIIENLIDAGHEDLGWFLFFIKKKQKDILDVPDEETKTEQ